MMSKGINNDKTSEKVIRFLSELDAFDIEHTTTKLKDVGNYHPRWVDGFVMLVSASQVGQIVDSANRYSIALHPYSTGRNWGFGSKSPVTSGGFLLDMSRMNKIRSIDFEKGIADIETGVTQAQLAAALEGSDWMLNVTSAGGLTGIVGNALENGVGIYRKRAEDLISIEAILGNGKQIKANSYHTDDQDEIGVSDFIKTTIGIVVSARIALLPRPEHIAICTTLFSTADTLKTLSICRELMPEEVISGIPKLFNREDDQSQLVLAISGTLKEMEEKIQTLQQRMPGESHVWHKDNADKDEMIKGQFELFTGSPSDRALKRYILKPGSELDIDAFSYLGFRLMAFHVPFDSQLIDWCVEKAKVYLHGLVTIDYTWNLWSKDALGLVIYIHFARNEEGAVAAAEMQSEWLKEFSELGIFPYRHDIDHMSLDQSLSTIQQRRKEQLKSQCDPNHILSPDKYL